MISSPLSWFSHAKSPLCGRNDGENQVRDDRGQLAGAEAIPFGLLIFVMGALLIANAWAVVDAKFAVDAAALEAARTFAEAPPTATYDATVATAEEAGKRVLESHGRDPDKLSFDVSGDTSLERCSTATFTGHYTVAAITLPFIGGYGDGFDVSASHTRSVDPLRSGVEGEATCL